jgi:arginyl-tRNA synthetase
LVRFAGIVNRYQTLNSTSIIFAVKNNNMNITSHLSSRIALTLNELYGTRFSETDLPLQITRNEFEGDYTLVVFPYLRLSGKSPEQTASEIGSHLIQSTPELEKFGVIKGFLNLSLTNECWISVLKSFTDGSTQLLPETPVRKQKVMVEFSSPNTNKPLHLGHIRNILLGDSVSRILVAAGHDVKKVNLVNDRGIHICKSMLAWQKFGNQSTPMSTGKKGDHLVGDYYVKFDQEYRRELSLLTEGGMPREEAEKRSPMLAEAQEMLRKWEENDPEVITLWKMMNEWVYKGFDETYRKMGILFDQTYFESETWMLGKSLVIKGLNEGILIKKEDGSIWADLTHEGLDEKILLRSDGTSVYMTQDLGTAHQRYREYPFDRLIYVVGNEQNYHFEVLVHILRKLGFWWAEHIYHLSYGMVELPSGKMKSREGTVVDADNLIAEMEQTALSVSEELGKLDELPTEEKERILSMIALGALKYFILKVDPRKNMTFIPEDSIDFNGHTGPFIQYTYARIQSLLRKNQAIEQEPWPKETTISLSGKERRLIRQINEFRTLVSEAAEKLSPALIANYVYDLTKDYNQFYHDYPVLKESNPELRQIRISLSETTGRIIKNGMELLGIEVPYKM